MPSVLVWSLLKSSSATTRRFASGIMGTAAKNKGMALFPRKIDGQFAMIGRQDNENLYLIRSDDLHVWNGGKIILGPKFPWEFVQMGNCGSPIELDEGWLLLTHVWRRRSRPSSSALTGVAG